MHLIRIVVVAGFALIAGSSGAMDRSDCRDAQQKYRSSKADLESHIKRYYNCIESSNGSDDCESEFHHIKNDQDDFESAVSGIRSDCDD